MAARTAVIVDLLVTILFIFTQAIQM